MKFETLIARKSATDRGKWHVMTAKRIIATVGHYLAGDGGDEAEAYARLFAAAPALLDALRGMLDLVEGEVIVPDDLDERVVAAFESAGIAP